MTQTALEMLENSIKDCEWFINYHKQKLAEYEVLLDALKLREAVNNAN